MHFSLIPRYCEYYSQSSFGAVLLLCFAAFIDCLLHAFLQFTVVALGKMDLD
jgi:hypothetical protein